jgi:hypothetical protein
MGEVPDWAMFIKAGKEAGVHPAILAGLPETIDCICWTNWILTYHAAETAGREQRDAARKRP